MVVQTDHRSSTTPRASQQRSSNQSTYPDWKTNSLAFESDKGIAFRRTDKSLIHDLRRIHKEIPHWVVVVKRKAVPMPVPSKTLRSMKKRRNVVKRSTVIALLLCLIIVGICYAETLQLRQSVQAQTRLREDSASPGEYP